MQKTLNEIIMISIEDGKYDDTVFHAGIIRLLNEVEYILSKNEVWEVIKDEPQWGKIPEREYAYLAGLTRYLCGKVKLPLPNWVNDDKYLAKEPYLVGDPVLWHNRLFAFLHSANEFELHNVFIDYDSLSVM